MGRAPYTVRARLYPDSEEVFDLVWYPCRDDAPALPYPSAINTLYQEGDRDDWLPTVVGEILGTAEIDHTITRKQFALGTHQCGTAADFAGEGVIDLSPPFVEYRADGLPSCCGDVRFHPALGGVVFGGQAGFVYYAPIGASGGFVLGGRAGEEVYTNTTARGGVEIGGAAGLVAYLPHPAAGGVELGGAAGLVVELVEAAAGGLVLGGAAGLVVELVEAAAGGLVLGGAAGFVPALPVAAAGGLVLGGAAGGTVSLPVAAAGGLVMGGAAGLVVSVAIPAAGGLVMGGAAGEVYTPPGVTPGLTCAAAGTIAPGQSYTGGMTSGQNNWFTFSGTNGVQYTVTVTVNSGGPSNVNFNKGSCASPSSETTSLFGTGSRVWTVSGGTHQIWIQVTFFGASLNYTLALSSP